MQKVFFYLSLIIGLLTADYPIMAQAQKSHSPAGVNKANQVKSFREWKGDKISFAQGRVEKTKLQLQQAKSRAKSNSNINLRQIDQELAQDLWDLEVAEDLSITDYLVLYLSQFPSPLQLAEAARRLSPNETAQILEAYIRERNQIPSGEAASLPSAANLISH